MLNRDWEVWAAESINVKLRAIASAVTVGDNLMSNSPYSEGRLPRVVCAASL